MEDSVQIGNRGDFGLWAIEAAKRIVSKHGFELAGQRAMVPRMMGGSPATPWAGDHQRADGSL